MKSIFLLLLALTTPAIAADNIIGQGSEKQLIDNSGRHWRAQAAFTTNGLGDIFTLGDVASLDQIIGQNPSGNRVLIDNAGNRWNASVLYTTDGAGNVIPIIGGVASVAAVSPLISSGGATPSISCQVASGSLAGCITSTDWTTFNGKQDALGFTPEDVANKDNGALSSSTTTYPTSGAVKIYVDNIHLISLDQVTLLLPASQSGAVPKSVAYYPTIQAALNAIPAATNTDDVMRIATIFVPSGIYLENLTMNVSRVRINMVALGPVTLGYSPEGSASSWTPLYVTSGAFNAGTDLITISNHGLANGTTMWIDPQGWNAALTSMGAPPTGLSRRTTYYVVNATTNTFQLSLTNGGAPIDFTDTGDAPGGYNLLVGTTGNVDITYSPNVGSLGGVRSGFHFSSLENYPVGWQAHPSYGSGGWRIMGSLSSISSPIGADLEIYFNGEIFGNIDFTASAATSFQLNLYNGRLRGGLFDISTHKTSLQFVDGFRFGGKIDVNKYSQINHSLIDQGMTVQSASHDYNTAGIYNTRMAGVFTGPVNSFLLDPVSNYWFVTNGASLGGSATKVFASALASATDTGEVSTGAQTIAGQKNLTSGVQLGTSAAQPTCNVGNRGLHWEVQGGAGVADLSQVCQKTVADTYLWVTH